MVERTVKRCYWDGGSLAVVLADHTVTLPGVDAIKALKRNEIVLEDEVGPIPLFDPDDPKRMQLIQERLSGLKD